MVRLLLSKGANRTIDGFANLVSMTVLSIAAAQLDLKMVDILLNAGAKPDALDLDRWTAIKYLPERTPANAEIWDQIALLLKLKQVGEAACKI